MFHNYDVLFGSAADGTVFASLHTDNTAVLAVLRDGGFVLNPGPGPTTFILPGLPLTEQWRAADRTHRALLSFTENVAYLVTTPQRPGTSAPDVTLWQSRAGISAQTRNPELVDKILTDGGFRVSSTNHALNERGYLLAADSPAPGETVLHAYQALTTAGASVTVLHPLTSATPEPPRYAEGVLPSGPLGSWPQRPAGPHPYPTASQRPPRAR
ncbi:hypothetical protein ACQPZG_31600 [Streptomyces sp. CA-294286]|uniref:hypothetical protein n=1 Tax=Streptomyces sp. CA-294286 TaxID=3240070 RepID=UPI003D8DA3DF